jgi:hypothetical protein
MASLKKNSLYFDRIVLTDIHIKHNRPDIIIYIPGDSDWYSRPYIFFVLRKKYSKQYIFVNRL